MSEKNLPMKLIESVLARFPKICCELLPFYDKRSTLKLAVNTNINTYFCGNWKNYVLKIVYCLKREFSIFKVS